MSSTLTAADARSARFALLVLTGMNLLNYIDRWVPSAVKPLFQKELNLTDAETSLPFSAFVVVYMIASPIFGTLADRVRRTWLIAAGVAMWSVATALGSLASGFYSLLLARAFVGVGEAAYATLAPSLLSDHYPADRRNKIFTIFYVAIPVGSALGFVIGGLLGERYGWRMSFVAVGVPGILISLLALLVKDPPRGRFDEDKKIDPPAWPLALRQLAANKIYICAVLGYVAVTFAVGGIADWFPTLLNRVHGIDLEKANSIAGTSVVVGGILGTVLGGIVGDKLKGRVRQPYLLMSGVTMIPAILITAYVMYGASTPLEFSISLTLCQTFLWMYNAPINALLVNTVGPALRARAFSLSILSIHILGDVISPPLIGKISDLTGNLRLACSLVVAALGVAAVVWVVGALTLKQDPEKALIV
jgi:MFS transporter, Spinster family, sphingosine-1-phosphate transporter